MKAPLGTVRRVNPVLVLGLLAVALCAVSLVAAGSGQVSIRPAEVFGSFMHHFGLDVGPMPTHPRGDATLWAVRFPRLVLATLVGAALGVAGAIMQGIFGNPLAEPSLVGVSAGAAVGASLVIVTGFTAAGTWSVAAGAFVCGLITCLLVYLLARSDGRTEVVTMVLTGIAVNAVAFGIIAYITFVAEPDAREQIVFWQLGSLNGARWAAVNVVFPLFVISLVIAWRLSRQLDLLALGERSARHVGVAVERLRITSIIVVAVLTAAAVAFTGVIAFVGLLVPHLVRMVLGPGHRMLLMGSALAGAIVVVAADLAARTLVDNADLPLGMLTALVGGPVFFWLLRRTRRSQGGWA